MIDPKEWASQPEELRRYGEPQTTQGVAESLCPPTNPVRPLIAANVDTPN